MALYRTRHNLVISDINTPGTRVGPSGRKSASVKKKKFILIIVKKYECPSWVFSKWVKSNARRRRKKSVKTMASYASVRHHRWNTQAAWTNDRNSYFFHSCTLPSLEKDTIS